jgi:methionyl-tRNA synthetase
MNKKILIGVAWPYVNGDLHLGHLAGYLLPADIFARFQRLQGNDVLMVSGSDCHGTPITVEADKSKLSPLEVVTKYHAKDLELFKAYDLSYNLYTKTTTENHKKVTQDIFLKLLNNGYIVKDVMKQYYSEADAKFLPDRYVEGTCPHCNAPEQRSDQCESCGRWLKDGELIDPKSKLTGANVVLKDSEHYFLDLAKLEPQLKEYTNAHKDIWRHWVWQETDGWLKEGLQKRAITRDMDWAIELPLEQLKQLPQEKQLSNYQGKHIYVWFEAVIGYLSAAIEWASYKNQEVPADVIFRRDPNQSTNWEDWWLNKDSLIFNFMGQDNLVFHTLMWPAQLIGTQTGYSLPHNVVVNKFLNYEGRKFSKSRNWTIDSMAMAKLYGADAIRYYISANLPENKEGNFTWDGFIAGVNNELVANLGNLINRTLKFWESKFAGKLDHEGLVLPEDIANKIKHVYTNMQENLDNCEFVAALEELMQYSRFGNKYFDDKKIWEVIKTDPIKAKQTMFELLYIVTQFPILMAPFLPQAATKLASLLQIKIEKWEEVTMIPSGLTEPVTILFNKLDMEKVLAQKDNLNG